MLDQIYGIWVSLKLIVSVSLPDTQRPYISMSTRAKHGIREVSSKAEWVSASFSSITHWWRHALSSLSHARELKSFSSCSCPSRSLKSGLPPFKFRIACFNLFQHAVIPTALHLNSLRSRSLSASASSSSCSRPLDPPASFCAVCNSSSSRSNFLYFFSSTPHQDWTSILRLIFCLKAASTCSGAS